MHFWDNHAIIALVIKMLEEVKRMKQAVETAGLSYMELERKTGVSHSTLQRYLNGKTNRIPLSAVEKIADATNVSAAWIMGWEDTPNTSAIPFPAPTVTDDVVTFPVIGNVAAGYNEIAIEDWSGDTVQIPISYLHNRPQSDYFVLNVHGDSMYPLYIDGDKVLVLKCDTLEHSGQIGVILYEGDNVTLKKIEYVDGENWLRLIPLNPNYPPKAITGVDLEQCRIIGMPKMLIRTIEQ